MDWTNTEIDHVRPICLFDVSKNGELGEFSTYNWKNTQPLLKQDHQHKWTKFTFLDYQLHFIKAYQFIKLNEKWERKFSLTRDRVNLLRITMKPIK